jgi:hypothetical protein
MVIPGAMDRAQHYRGLRLGKAMPRFVQFLQHSGVYAEQDFMIVPRPGFNLVCLRDSKDVRLSYDPDRLQVDSVGLEDVERVALEYINYRYGKQKSQERDDQLLRLRTALVATARPEGLARGYKVTAKGIGVPELKATRGNIGVKLAVGLLPRKDFKIAFKFLRQLDSSGKVINATKWTPDDAPWMLTRLNWTFGAQANIFFTSVEAAWFTVQKALGPTIMRDVFRTDIVPHKTRGAYHVLSRRRLRCNGDRGGRRVSARRAGMRGCRRGQSTRVRLWRSVHWRHGARDRSLPAPQTEHRREWTP